MNLMVSANMSANRPVLENPSWHIQYIPMQKDRDLRFYAEKNNGAKDPEK